MAYPNIAFPWERDQVIMEIFLSANLSPEAIRSLGRCRVLLESIFLSDLTTADGKYLEDFVFIPSGREKASTFKFPRERPTWSDWNLWFDFWHSFTTTGDKLKVPLGNWISPTHHIWKWYYRADTDDLQRVKGDTMFHYKPPSGFCFTRARKTYHVMREEHLSPSIIQGVPTSVTSFSAQQVIKLSEGPALVKAVEETPDFWELLYSWGGTWMWEGMEAGKDSPDNISWIADGLKKQLSDMGYGWVIRQEKGQGPVWGGVDYFLYQHRIPSNRHLLGKIYLSKFIQGRIIRAMCLASPGTGSGGVLQGRGMVRYAML
jgi:hypothetical protein